MELWHDNGGNYEHFTLGVEVEHSEHQTNSRYEMQRIGYRTPNQRPAYHFRLQWAGIHSEHTFDLQLDHFNPLSGSHQPVTLTGLRVGMSAWDFKREITDYMKLQYDIG